MRFARRTIIAVAVSALAGACGDQSLGGAYGDAGADSGGNPPSGSAGDGGDTDAPGLSGLDEAGVVNSGPCGATTLGTTQGCEFYSVAPAVWPPVSGSCFAAMIVNTSSAPVSIKVDIDATSLDVSQIARIAKGTGGNITYDPLPSGLLPAGETAMLFLARFDTDEYLDDVDCPKGIVPGFAHDPAIIDTGRGSAFHITTNAPVAAFDIFPYGGEKGAIVSASLLIPTNAWGKGYIAVDPYQADPALAAVGETCDPFLQVVAAEDATKVTIRPTTDILGGSGVAASPKGTPQTYTLGKGEVLQFKRPFTAAGDDPVLDRLMGSPISSDKPISIWGGGPGVYGSVQCDSSHQQVPPTTALGFEYVAVRYRDRLPTVHESVPWTVVGVVDGTPLTYDPAPPPGAPTTINGGQIAIFNAPEAFSIRSPDNKHPFYFAGHMTGFTAITTEKKPTDGGEPEFVNAVPPEQWLTAYSFLTDPTFRNTNLVFIRKKAADATFKDVTLDCAGPLAGWEPVGTAGTYELTRVDLAVKGVPAGTCDNGPHTAKSDAPFGLTIWGWDDIVSYAYPAGGGVRAINDVPPPK